MRMTDFFVILVFLVFADDLRASEKSNYKGEKRGDAGEPEEPKVFCLDRDDRGEVIKERHCR
jgi:hypothetical protein